MNCLAIDTSTNICSVGLYVDNKIIDVKNEVIDSSHTKILAVNVESIIKDNNIDLCDLDYFILSIGPGSYSGLRVGASFIKGLAYASSKSIIPINTIHSMGLGLDIRGEYYIAIFSHRDYVFYQEFNDGHPIGEQGCSNINRLKQIPFYGYGLNKIPNMDYIEIKPSSLNLINYLLKNNESLISEKKHISEISPIYLEKEN